jgi:2-methylcitrate dehydratase PrpD
MIGTVAEIQMQNGAVLRAECEIPKGFAGDPEKRTRVMEKFERECNPIYGEKRTAFLRKHIMETGFPGLTNY